jgi:DNA-binding MarR family transcriptional regulator
VTAFAALPAPSTERLQLVLEADLGLLALADRLRQHWATQATALGLSAVQAKVLLQLTPGAAVPMRRVAQQLGYDASNLTTLIDRLEEQGSVERRTDASDRRVKALVLTDAGARLRSEFWHRLVEDAGPLTPIDGDELQTLLGILEKLDRPPEEHHRP